MPTTYVVSVAGPEPARRPYRVTTSLGTRTLMAPNPAAAIRDGLELCGPDAQFLSCLQEGEW